MPWFHLKCVDLEVNDLDTIRKKGIHWYCEKCDHVFSAFDSRVKAVESKIQDLTEAQQSKAVETYVQVVSKLEQTNSALDKHIKDQEKHLKDQEKQLKHLRNDLTSDARAKTLLFLTSQKQRIRTHLIILSLR